MLEKLTTYIWNRSRDFVIIKKYIKKHWRIRTDYIGLTTEHTIKKVLYKN